MLFALATAGSAFKPSMRTPSVSPKLKKFKQIYLEKCERAESSWLVYQAGFN